MSIEPSQFVEIAQRWQDYHRRNPKSAMGKLKEELEEYFEAANYNEELDELGDVLVLAMRVLVALTPAEQEAVYEIAKMKADRRLVSPRKKIKPEEYKLRDDIIRDKGLTGV